ncbi:MAG: SDR family oxidoreductase [Actinobacteria bacterium]|nr:SDR family oxidoreductase [Actinomycetota bacterium]
MSEKLGGVEDSRPPRIAITGPDGFIAWHTRCALRAREGGGDAFHLAEPHFDDPDVMDAVLAEADAVIHLAGVNRASDDATIAEVNPWLARCLVESLERLDKPIPIVYGNSIHSRGDSGFGVAKRQSADILRDWGRRSGAPVADVVLPNIFGEHGTPFYNSVVATFCHLLANDQQPEIQVDREMPLLHVQRAASVLLDAAAEGFDGEVAPAGTPTTVTGVLERLLPIRDAYRSAILPDLSDPFTRDLFNTYRSYTFPQQWPIYPEVRGDQRGELFETVKAPGGQTQVFFSTTNPGFTRGQHYHLHKVERFLVLRGEAVIRLRKVFSDEVVEFSVSGDRPGIIDMPTMWVHSITNTGDDELITLFYADEVFDPANPDTFPEEV